MAILRLAQEPQARDLAHYAARTIATDQPRHRRPLDDLPPIDVAHDIDGDAIRGLCEAAQLGPELDLRALRMRLWWFCSSITTSGCAGGLYVISFRQGKIRYVHIRRGYQWSFRSWGPCIQSRRCPSSGLYSLLIRIGPHGRLTSSNAPRIERG